MSDVSDPVARFRAKLEASPPSINRPGREKVAELEARIRELEAMVFPRKRLDLRGERHVDGLERDARGNVVCNGDPQEVYEANMAAQREHEARELAEYERSHSEGLPPGCYVDPCGVVRNRETGNVTYTPEVAVARDADLIEVRATQAADHRAWLRNQGLRPRSKAERMANAAANAATEGGGE